MPELVIVDEAHTCLDQLEPIVLNAKALSRFSNRGKGESD